MKNRSFKPGIGFGLASGVITTLGLMIGLFSSTNSKGIVLTGVFTIAFADSFSDAIGIHFSEESKGIHSDKEIWAFTFLTFITKLFVALSFVPLILLLSLNQSIVLNIILGFLMLSVFSYMMAKNQNKKPLKVILEHVFATLFVISLTYYLGKLINKIFI